MLHDLAHGFAGVAADYERGRPGYPPALAALLRDDLGLGPGSTVLDLGAGTGKLTRTLLATGARVLAAEPLPGMRAALAAVLPMPAILDAPAEALPLDDASLDGAASGDAWHWFDGRRALDELARVLRPGAPLVLAFHRARPAPWEEALLALLAAHRPDHPYFAGRALDPFEGRPDFAALERRELAHEHPTDRAGVLAGVASISYVAKMDEPARRALLDGAERILDTAPAEIVQRFAVDVVVTRRRPG